MPSKANSLINQILEYLEGKLDYNVGLSLFMRISTDKVILLQLIGLETPKKKQLLTQQLTDYYEDETSTKLESHKQRSRSNPSRANSKVHAAISRDETPIYVSNDYRFTPVDSIPESNSVIIALADERKKYYRLRGNLHADLYNAISDDRRHELAEQIMAIQFKIDVVNDEIRKVEQGLLPERFIRKSRTAEQYHEIRNCQQYIHKYKKWLDRSTTPEEREKNQKFLDKYEDKLKTLINE